MSAIHRHYASSLSQPSQSSPKTDMSSPEKQQQEQQSPPPASIPNYDDHWVYEQIVLRRVPGISLGFCVGGGVDNPLFGHNTNVFVTKISPGGLAELDGRLRVNDVLCKVNETVLDEVAHTDAVQALRDAGKIVSLTVKRLQPVLVKEITLDTSTRNGFGFSISGGIFTEHVKNDHGLFVTKIWPGGEADLDGRLSIGDRIISLNGISLEYVTHEEAVATIGEIAEKYNQITLKVGKVTQVIDQDEFLREPRLVCLRKKEIHESLGFNIVGGVGGDGIFVSFIITGGLADLGGELRKGDQILSVNDVDVTQATHEQAAEMLRQADVPNVVLVVAYRPEAYERFQTRVNERREQIINSQLALGLATKAVSASNLNTATTNGGFVGTSTGLVGGVSTNMVNSNLQNTAMSLTNLSNMLMVVSSSATAAVSSKQPKRRTRSFYVRALFTHEPSKDSGIPGKGLAFAFGDVLHVLNAADDEWWQAKRVLTNSTNSSATTTTSSAALAEIELGIVPSKKRVERRERARQRRVNFGKNLLLDATTAATSTTNGNGANKITAAAAAASNGVKKKPTTSSFLKVFKKGIGGLGKKGNTARSADDLNDNESKRY